MSTELELVSFPLCPFVQRSVITLRHKKIEFKATYIDLEKPPEWFTKISPLGKVPVLRVRPAGREEIVLFESAVINEYLDATLGSPMIPADPLARARDRAWIECASEALMTNYSATMATDPAEAETSIAELFDTLGHVEGQLASGPYWHGKELSLVDAAWAPLFMRLKLLPVTWKHSFWRSHAKTRAWAEALLATPEVKESVLKTFDSDYLAYLRRHGSALT